ncbi:hypothetical protein BJY01DRAFT_205147 [Aspergillus pseudoustus]|uniref:Uncharacterized protein n=1 Tax=Aspergillus pseudoustus TaxID=1810923 RepID=A0ABR4KRI1_9EURO
MLSVKSLRHFILPVSSKTGKLPPPPLAPGDLYRNRKHPRIQDTVNTKLTPMSPESWKHASERFLAADDPFRPLLATV